MNILGSLLVSIGLLVILVVLAVKSVFKSKIPPGLKKGIYGEWNHRAIEEITKTCKSSFSFAIVGDPHNSCCIFGDIIRDINDDESIKFVIILGDITQRGSLEEYLIAIDKLKKLKKPTVVLIGNHDIHKNGRDWFYKFFGYFYFYFKVGNSCFVMLDTSEKRYFPSFELKWLEDVLKSSYDCNLKFVFSHIPLFDPAKGEKEKGHSIQDFKLANLLLELLKKYNVDTIFCGHIHGFFSGYWDSLKFYVSGGGGGDLGGVGENYFYHYLKVTIIGDKCNVEIIEVKTTPSKTLLEKVCKRYVIPFTVYLSKNSIPITLIASFSILFGTLLFYL
ncbi:MAG: metallophosphoesterase family protein [Thermosulfidibacteraceae bacterium]